MQKITYVPPGAENGVELELKEPFIFSKVKGVSGVECDMISSNVVGMQGSVFHRVKKPPRIIDCTLYVHGSNRREMYQNRMNLIGMFRPQNQAGTVYYTNDFITVKTAAVPQLPGDFSVRLHNYNQADIRLWCPDPDWLSIQTRSASIAAQSGTGFRLPFQFPFHFHHTKNEIIIENMGTTITPVTVTITGPGVNPSLTNMTTGETIALDNRILDSGECLIITTARGKKAVTFVRNDEASDGFQFISPMSVFWSLVPGENKIAYASDDNSEATNIRIEWTERYEGV